MEKVKVGIIGGAGYTGGELLRVLLNHDRVEIAFVQSRSRAGQSLASAHPDLLGTTDLQFTEVLEPSMAAKLHAVFLALPHGEAEKFLHEQKLPSSVKVIDLSHDFRLKKSASLQAESGLRQFVYGLPELNREAVRKSNSIANPGCFATAIQFALLPLAKAKKLGRVAVTGITGSTGAGLKLSHTSHFSFRANNVQAYKTLSHQHVAEIEESLHFLQGDSKAKVSFVPWRGDFTRGIFVTALIPYDAAPGSALKLFQDFYQSHPFVAVTSEAIDLKSVVNTNRALIEVHEADGELAVSVAIDNLLKGASGQAVQNLNLMMGFPETTGLKLKGTAF
jgi:N-acetyl-gamma-glutamyl-phosphate reductase